MINRQLAGAGLAISCLMAALSAGCATTSIVANATLDGLPSGAMQQQLRGALRSHGLAIADETATEVGWRVEVLEVSEDQRVLRINRHARDAELLLRGQLRVRIERNGEETTTPARAIIRQYHAERRQVLLRPDSDATQTRQLREEIRAELAEQVAATARWEVDAIK